MPERVNEPEHVNEPRHANEIAWLGVLDDLERRLGLAAADADASVAAGQASASAAAPLSTWTPPQGIGPIPAELVERATALLAGQRELSSELDSARNDVARHLAAIRSVPAMRAPSASVYLDVTG